MSILNKPQKYYKTNDFSGGGVSLKIWWKWRDITHALVLPKPFPAFLISFLHPVLLTIEGCEIDPWHMNLEMNVSKLIVLSNVRGQKCCNVK